MRTTVVLPLFCLFATCAFAQNESNPLDPVTVTATVSPTFASKTGRNVVVIKGEQISALPVNSVDELLRFLPGLEMQFRGPMGAQSDISIRGGTFQQVLVILDGIRLNDPLTGHFSSYIPLPASEIERIEVLKGASSAIYGTEAVGGVVHIISKTFAKTHRQSGLQAQVTGGEYGLWSVNAGANLTGAKTSLSAGILSNHARGQPQRGTRGFFDLTTASLSLSHQLNDGWSVSLRSAYDLRDFSAQNFYTTFASDTATEKVTSWWHHGQLRYSGEGFRWITDVGYKTVTDIFAFNPLSVPNNNQSTLLQALSRVEWALSTQTLIVAGVQHLQKGIESNDRGNHQVGQTAAFVVLDQRFGDYFTMAPSVRFDYHQRAGFEVVPQVNLSYRRDNYQLRGSAGRTIRDADFTERFNNYGRALVTSGRIGNPDLVAEGAWSAEAGADWWIGKGLKLSTSVFGRFQRRLIDWVNTPYAQMPRKDNLVPNGTYALATNISKVRTLGWEGDLQYIRDLGNDRSLTAALGLVWLESKGPQGQQPSFYLSSHARWLVNTHLMYRHRWLRLSATALYKQREAQRAPAIEAEITPSYWVTNLKAEAFITPQFSWFVQVDNVADRRYADLLGSPMPGRWSMTGLTFRLP